MEDQYLETVTIHEREYQRHSIEHNIHLVPVDEVVALQQAKRNFILRVLQEEADRLTHLHEVFNIIFDDRLIFPPIIEPQRILDCGYGAACWAVEAAEAYPESEVRLTIPNDPARVLII